MNTLNYPSDKLSLAYARLSEHADSFSAMYSRSRTYVRGTKVPLMHNQSVMKQKEKLVTPIHEAGHIVIALLLGIRVSRVVIKVNTHINSSGYVLFSYNEQPTDFDLECRILLDLAGTAAEKACVSSNIPWTYDGDMRSALKNLVMRYIDSDDYMEMNLVERTSFLNEGLNLRKECCLKFLSSNHNKRMLIYIARTLKTKRSLNYLEIEKLARHIGVLGSKQSQLLRRSAYRFSAL